MVPFRLPEKQKREINRSLNRKEMIVNITIKEMERALRKAAEEIIDNAIATGDFMAPSLNSLDVISENFYRNIIKMTFQASQDEKKTQLGVKKLAKMPTGLPKSRDALAEIFKGDNKYWRRIMNRSRKLTARMKKSYLKKLRSKFEQVMPLLNSGEIDASEAKKSMMEGWEASKSRVETIFRTETTTYFAKTQIVFFEKDEQIIGFMFDSIRDSSRTPICQSRHGLIYRPGTKLLRKNTPACHYGCRSHLIALANTAYNRKMLEDPSRDPAKRSVVPLPNGWGQ